MSTKKPARIYSLELVDPTAFAVLCRSYFEAAALLKFRSQLKPA